MRASLLLFALDLYRAVHSQTPILLVPLPAKEKGLSWPDHTVNIVNLQLVQDCLEGIIAGEH